MIIEVKQWPESQEVMGKPGWFFIMDGNPDSSYNGSRIGDSAYGRILEDKTHTAGDIVYDNPMYETVSITDLELFIYMINRGTAPHKALQNMIEHNQELKETRKYLNVMISDIDKSEDDTSDDN